MSARWSLDDINWDAFDGSKVDPDLLKAVKAAAMVEYNATDYVTYLCNVFNDRPDIQELIVQWGAEEVQHGAALGRWCELADPDFSMDVAFERFLDIYRIPLDVEESVRGSRAGELVARCVVESGTSSFYTAIKEATDEPVLKQVAQKIAADEWAHFKLFLDTLAGLDEKPSMFEKAKVALSRVSEADDDELASAYFAANTKPGDGAVYDRKKYAAAYEARALGLYKRQHTNSLINMIARTIGLAPHGRFIKIVKPLVWRVWQHRQRKAAAIAV